MKSVALDAQHKPESLLSDVCTLVKARLSLLVLATTLVGFLLGWRGPVDCLVLVATLVGTALCACGAAALNQWYERDVDGLMKRTKNRPLPAGRMHPQDALLFGVFFSLTGLFSLLLFTNDLTALLAATTIGIYIFVYTPMKRISALNTLIGAVPGALPPLIGWTAATGSIRFPGLVLFAILWLWQMPHFLAIAWMYKEDYAHAGLIFLSGDDPDGAATSRQSLHYATSLLVVSLLPGVTWLDSPLYFGGALVLGIAFSILALRFALHRSKAAARVLFLGSLLYLPLLLGLLVASRAI